MYPGSLLLGSLALIVIFISTSLALNPNPSTNYHRNPEKIFKLGPISDLKIKNKFSNARNHIESLQNVERQKLAETNQNGHTDYSKGNEKEPKEKWVQKKEVEISNTENEQMDKETSISDKDETKSDFSYRNLVINKENINKFLRRRYIHYDPTESIEPMAQIHIQPVFPPPEYNNRKCGRCVVIYKPCSPRKPQPHSKPPKISLPVPNWRRKHRGE